MSTAEIAEKIRRQMADYQQGVGQRLRGLREMHRLSQEDAAHKVKVAVKTWSNWERGRTAPYESNWKKIAEAFKLAPAEIEVLRGSPPAPLGLDGTDPALAQLQRIENKLDEVLALLKQPDPLGLAATLEPLRAHPAPARTAPQEPAATRQRRRRAG